LVLGSPHYLSELINIILEKKVGAGAVLLHMRRRWPGFKEIHTNSEKHHEIVLLKKKVI